MAVLGGLGVVSKKKESFRVFRNKAVRSHGSCINLILGRNRVKSWLIKKVGANRGATDA